MRLAALMAAVLLLSGCRAESTIQSPKPADDQDVEFHKHAQERPAEIALHGHLGDDTQIAPTGGQWPTEQLSQQVDASLKSLSKHIVQNVPDTELTFVDERLRTTKLRPAGTQVVYKDESLVVRRWQREPAETPEIESGRGPAALRSALQTMIAPVYGSLARDTGLAHGKFKVVKVQTQDGELRTELFWQLSVPASYGNYQQTATWDCQWTLDSGEPRLKAISLTDFQEVQTESRRQFVDHTADVTRNIPDFAAQFGQSIDYWLDRIEYRFGILPSSYQGISVADVNGDGLEDVFIAQPGGVSGGLPNRLLVQQANGSVIDRSAESGLDWLIETHSALFVDLDNDGDQDVIVATVMGLVFAANDGQGLFQRRFVKITPDAPPMSLAAADFDNDRDLDIYVCCYSPRTSSPLMGRPIPYHDANNGGRNLMLRNDRDWRFRDVTREVGMDNNNRRFSFAASWEDDDNDGDMDLYVANDYGRNNLFRNEGGRFRDVAAEMGVEDISAGMSVAWGDYDRDGWMDLYVSNMWSSAGKRIAYQRQFQADADSSTRATFQRHARGNSLFANQMNSGKPAFNDVSVAEGVTMGRWAWASQFADINNNGFLDILVANGFITQEDTSDL